MRQFFAAGMVVSLVGAALFGAVYAFSQQVSSGPHTTSVGAIDLDLVYTPDGTAVLGPNDNSYVPVGDGTVENTASSDFSVTVNGDVSIDSVTEELPTPGGDACETGDFDGQVTGLGVVLAPGAAAAPFDAEISTSSTAPENCQGDDVDYTVTVTGTT